MLTFRSEQKRDEEIYFSLRQLTNKLLNTKWDAFFVTRVTKDGITSVLAFHSYFFANSNSVIFYREIPLNKTVFKKNIKKKITHLLSNLNLVHFNPL